MVSLRSRFMEFVMGMMYSENCFKNPNYLESKIVQKSRASGMHIKKAGYTVTIKESTELKANYVIVKKETNQDTKKIIYYLHGGTYVMRMLRSYEEFCQPFCDLRDDLEVVLIDYSLAPEYKYPTQLNEAFDVWKELVQRVKPEDIIIGGDSAGGNLAMALIHKLKKEEHVAPGAAFFLSPWTDLTCSGKSFTENYKTDVLTGDSKSSLTPEMLEEMKKSYLFCFLEEGVDRTDPYVSPLFGDFTTFPKSLFIAGSKEMLLDDTTRVVEQLKENGQEVQVLIKEGMFHAYPVFAGFAPEGQEAMELIKKFITESL